MPDLVIVEPAFPSFFGPTVGGDVPGSTFPTSPFSITTPGVHMIRVPLDVTTPVFEVWAGASGGGAATSAATKGAQGGGGSGYGKASVGSGLYVPGGIITVTIGAGGDGSTSGGPGNGHLSKVEIEGFNVVQANATANQNGGTVTILSHAGVTSITNTTGANGVASVGAAGGKGGTAAGTGGGAGGSGGSMGFAGIAGKSPGGGGGGGGSHGGTGGKGAAGGVIITW